VGNRVGEFGSSAGVVLAIGFGGARWLGTFLESQLCSVSPHDPVTQIGVAAVLTATACAAAYLPGQSAATAQRNPCVGRCFGRSGPL
jgi:hypothetical protein